MKNSLEPKVYIVTVNFNGYQDTIQCLESLQKLEYRNVQAVVCDNASSDDSIAKITAWAGDKLETIAAGTTQPSDAQIILIPTGQNLGFAGGNNVGFRWLLAQGDADYIWVLNNDTVVEPSALTELVERMKADPQIGMCGSAVCFHSRPDVVQAYAGAFTPWLGLSWHVGENEIYNPAKPPHDIESKMAFTYGASMMVSRRFLVEVGLMSEVYFIYHEELDWAFRARNKFKMAVAPRARVYHKDSQTIGKSQGQTSPIADYYFTRGRILLTWKYFPAALPLVYLSMLFVLTKRLFRGQFEHMGVVIKAMLHPGAPVNVG